MQIRLKLYQASVGRNLYELQVLKALKFSKKFDGIKGREP